MNLEQLKRSPQFQQIAGSWDAIAAGILEVVNSEIANLHDLKQADLKKLLVSASQQLVGVPLPKFGNVEVSTVLSDDQSATLAYRESKGGELKQVEFVKIDGKWLPKSLVNNWSDETVRMKERFAKMAASVTTIKPKLVRSLDSVNELIDAIEFSKNQEAFNEAVIKFIFAVRMEMLTLLDAVQSASAIPRQEAAMRLEIARELTDGELTTLRDTIRAARPGDAVEYEMIPGDGKTRCRFTPIAEPDRLVALLQKHFDGADVKRNVDTHTIRIEWK